MRFLNYLQEKYIGTAKSRYSDGGHVTIYSNPSKLEMKLIQDENSDPNGEVRFIADNSSKEVFVWAYNLIHRDAWSGPLHKKTSFNDTEGLLPGIAKKVGNKYEMIGSDMVELAYNPNTSTMDVSSELRDVFLETDWKWVNKYISVDKYVKKYKKKYMDNS